MAILSDLLLFLSIGNDNTGQFYITAVTWKLCRIDHHGHNRSLTSHSPAWKQQLFLEKNNKLKLTKPLFKLKNICIHLRLSLDKMFLMFFESQKRANFPLSYLVLYREYTATKYTKRGSYKNFPLS